MDWGYSFKLICGCGVVYLVIAVPVLFWLAKRMRYISQFYPDAEDEKENYER